MNNYLLRIAYDGTRFRGWQKTCTGPSIEEELEQVLQKILNHPVSLQAASRTDAGVHAQEQAVQFFSPKEIPLSRLQHSLNCLLPEEIAVMDAQKVPLSFHPTLHCEEKIYCYRCCAAPVLLPHDRWTTWHVPHVHQWKAMEEGCAILEGTHDFSAFCNQKKNETYENCIREILSIELKREENGFFSFQIRGKKFLYKMVRNLVGTLVDIGRGKIALDSLKQILENKDRPQAGVTAPALGLTLQKVSYPASLFFETAHPAIARETLLEKRQGVLPKAALPS